MRHVEHALKVCGEDHVGIGSDMSVSPIEETPEYVKAERAFAEGRAKRGYQAPDEDRPLYIPDLNQPRRLELIAERLAARGHSSDGHREGHRRQLQPGVQRDLGGLTSCPATSPSCAPSTSVAASSPWTRCAATSPAAASATSSRSSPAAT